MLIGVKLFASYRELIGEEELQLELEEGSTVGEALRLIKEHYPVLAEQGYSPMTACNLKHVSKQHCLSDGDELAIFPPVSGG
ncbi:MAG: MoaD/ThiS family protein [Acidobacteriota bacterium]